MDVQSTILGSLKTKLRKDAEFVDTVFKKCNIVSNLKKDLDEKIIKNNRYLHHNDRDCGSSRWIIK